MRIQRRDIALAIIFSIITCGIYSIFWFVKMTDEVNVLTGNQNDTSGVLAFVLTLVTCGIYGFYWSYKMGDKVERYEGTNGSKGVLYLILTLFGFGIIAYALIQDSINKIVDNNANPLA